MEQYAVRSKSASLSRLFRKPVASELSLTSEMTKTIAALLYSLTTSDCLQLRMVWRRVVRSSLVGYVAKT